MTNKLQRIANLRNDSHIEINACVHGNFPVNPFSPELQERHKFTETGSSILTSGGAQDIFFVI